MARSDWNYVGISKYLANAITRFLETEEAKKLEIKNKTEFLNNLVDDFFEKYKELYGKEFRIQNKTKLFDLVNINEEGQILSNMIKRGELEDSIKKKSTKLKKK